MIHKNSRESYEKCKKDENFKRIIHRIARFFETNNPGLFTDKEVRDTMWKEELLPYWDMNVVRPKINKLRDDGMLVEDGKKYDDKTERNVRTMRWAL